MKQKRECIWFKPQTIKKIKEERVMDDKEKNVTKKREEEKQANGGGKKVTIKKETIKK